MNDILKLETISFKKYYVNNYFNNNIKKEYLQIEFAKIFRYPSLLDIDIYVSRFVEEKIPIHFVYDIEDNLKLKDINITYFNVNDIYNSKYQVKELVSDDNILCSIINTNFYGPEYILYVNLNNNEVLRKKIYSHDYKLFMYYYPGNFIVKLIYSPDIRKYKLQQIEKYIDE